MSVTDRQIRQFNEDGFLVLPGHVPEDVADLVRSEVDRWVDDGLRVASIEAAINPEATAIPETLEVDLPGHGRLLAYEPLMQVIETLMGSRFAFHHLHSDRHEPGRPGKPWHHDYEHPDGERTHMMLHTLHYLDGISKDMASLVVLPGSHRETSGKGSRDHLGTNEIDGEFVIDELPPRSSVVLHSALFHARRAKPEENGEPRYFVDSSYCEVGTRWSSVKPYWREILSRARRHDLAPNRPELFSEESFTEYARPRRH